MKTKLQILILTLAALFLLVSSEPAAPIVLIMQTAAFDGISVDQTTDRSVTDPLIKQFERFGYAVRTMKPDGLLSTGKEGYLTACRTRAREAGAVQVVVPMVSKTGNWFVLEIALIDTVSGETLDLEIFTATDLGELGTGAIRLAKQIPVLGQDSLNNTTVKLWSFTNEFEEPITYFEERNPGIHIILEIIPSEDMPTTLHQAMKEKKNMPDLFTAEASFLPQFIEAGYYEYLDHPPYNADTSALIPYTVERGKDAGGRLVTLSWQATPGMVFYRRSMAKRYLGTDDPAEVEKRFASWEAMLETGRIIEEKSSGNVFLVPGISDLNNMVMCQRSQPWVVDGRFVLDQKLVDFFDIAKALQDGNMTAGYGQWSPAWFDGMKKNSDVFSYYLPTWGLRYVMKSNAPDSSGDWGACLGPVNWYWGGTWLGINKKTTDIKKKAAWEFIKMMVLDPDFLVWWIKETGDFVSHTGVVKRVQGTFSEPYLNGQNRYQMFSRASHGINGSNVTTYDDELNSIYFLELTLFLEGELTKSEAIANIKIEAKKAFPDLIVE